jgi:hypothetical protein
MQYLTYYDRREKADLPHIGRKHEIFPENWEEALHKDAALEQVIETAYRMPADRRPRDGRLLLLVKPSLRSRWHLKLCPADEIGDKIEKARRFRKLDRYILHIIKLRE